MPTVLTIGVDVGGTKCLGVAVGADGVPRAQHRLPTPSDGPGLLDAVADVVTTLQEKVGTVEGVGVGVPGLVDRRGVLRFAPNIPGVTELAVGQALTERLGGARVQVDNDATCAGWAETVGGAATGCGNVLLVTLGTGIGGGLVVGGRLMRGANGFAGEIGHIVVDPHGPLCPCGQRGCWERYASGSGLGWMGREAAQAGQAGRVVELAGGDPEDVRGEHVTRAAAGGDAQAQAVMGRFAWWLALGLANLANVLDPERIVLGGGMVEAGEVLLRPTRDAFHGLVEAADHRPEINIVPAALGELAGAVGAALLARPRAPGDSAEHSIR
jgi:glucokinase